MKLVRSLGLILISILPFASSAIASQAAMPEGTYRGTIHLTQDSKNYECILEIKRVLSQASGTNAMALKLVGSLHFPAVENASLTDLAKYTDLLDPMGGYAVMLFDYGTYDAKTGATVLTYTIPAYNGAPFGELQGTADGGHFSGAWFTKAFGTVATFDLNEDGSSQ